MGKSPTSASNGQAGQFPNTRWSMWHEAVHLDGEQASTALEQICTAYWYPLYAFARRKGQSPEDASDLTQSFFANLLEKNWLADADQQRGKLRTFLLTSFQRFHGPGMETRADPTPGRRDHLHFTRTLQCGGPLPRSFHCSFGRGTLRPPMGSHPDAANPRRSGTPP